MPRVTHVKKARRAVEHVGIAVGDSYYWWKFRHGGKRFSKTPPKGSQLTQSAYIGGALAIQEDMAEWAVDDLGRVEEICDLVRELGEECGASLENMPESLQYSPTGELLQERVDACEQWADELESVEIPERDDYEDGEEGDEEYNDAVEAALDEIKSIEPEVM